jgi:hypothetical protein
MTRWKRMSTIALPVCAATGIMFGFLPRTWIELRFGVDPDGGSGLFEFLITALPIAVGLGLAIRRITLYRNMTSQATEKVDVVGEKAYFSG